MTPPSNLQIETLPPSASVIVTTEMKKIKMRKFFGNFLRINLGSDHKYAIIRSAAARTVAVAVCTESKHFSITPDSGAKRKNKRTKSHTYCTQQANSNSH